MRVDAKLFGSSRKVDFNGTFFSPYSFSLGLVTADFTLCICKQGVRGSSPLTSTKVFSFI